jgi:hypothetical protein
MKIIFRIDEQRLPSVAVDRMHVRKKMVALIRRTHDVAFLLTLLYILAATQLWGQSIVAPNEFAEQDGDTSSTSISGNAGGTRIMYLYDASQFQSLSKPAYLTSFAWRPDQNVGPSGPRTGTYKVFVSTTHQAPADFSTQFSDNIGEDNTLVFDGTFTQSTENKPGPGNTRQFDYVFSFTTPFLYDPSAGNLVVDLQIAEGSGEAVRIDSLTSSPVAKCAFASGSGTAASGFFSEVPVAQLTFESAPRLTIRTSQVELCWESVSNATYRVEWQSDSTQNSWTPLVNCIRSSGPITCIQDSLSPGASRRWYRAIRTSCTP